jgi:hypothetical protein
LLLIGSLTSTMASTDPVSPSYLLQTHFLSESDPLWKKTSRASCMTGI